MRATTTAHKMTAWTILATFPSVMVGGPLLGVIELPIDLEQGARQTPLRREVNVLGESRQPVARRW